MVSLFVNYSLLQLIQFFIFLNIESPVLVKLYSKNEQTKGSDIELTSNVAKGSKPLRFQWFKNGVE